MKREEIVGKRFLSVSGFIKLKQNKISEWGWRAGVIRASSHRDNKHPDLQVNNIHEPIWRTVTFFFLLLRMEILRDLDFVRKIFFFITQTFTSYITTLVENI